jgi:hypothetical protein
LVTSSAINKNAIRSIAYGDGNFAAGLGNNRIAYSSDNGETWTTIDTVEFVDPAPYFKVAYGNGKFVAAPTQMTSQVYFSDDKGATWKPGDNFPIETPDGMAYCNGKFVVVGHNWDQRQQ